MSTKRSTRATLVLVAGLAAMATQPAHAGRAIASRYYEGTNGFSFVSRPDPSCQGYRCTLSKDGTIDIGGVRFAPINKRDTRKVLVTFSVYDDRNTRSSGLGARVSYFACQDLNKDGICGDAEAREPALTACSGMTPRSLRVRKNLPVTVFVRTVWGCPVFLIPDVVERPGIGSTGKVTMRYFP